MTRIGDSSSVWAPPHVLERCNTLPEIARAADENFRNLGEELVTAGGSGSAAPTTDLTSMSLLPHGPVASTWGIPTVFGHCDRGNVSVLVTGRHYWGTCWLPRCRITGLRLECQVAGHANKTARIALYTATKSSGYSYPNTLVYGSGTLSISSTGFRTVDLTGAPLDIDLGQYCFAICSDTAGVWIPRGYLQNTYGHMNRESAQVNYRMLRNSYISTAYAAFADPFPTGAVTRDANTSSVNFANGFLPFSIRWEERP